MSFGSSSIRSSMDAGKPSSVQSMAPSRCTCWMSRRSILERCSTAMPQPEREKTLGTREVGQRDLSKAKPGRLHEVMAGYVDRGEAPGIVTLVSERGHVEVDAIGRKTLERADPIRRVAFEGARSCSRPLTDRANTLHAFPRRARRYTRMTINRKSAE